MSRICAALLMALVIVTAQGAAHARGMADPAGKMVICTGTGPVMVYMDEDGQPTQAPHLCPEFALSLILDVAGFDPTVTRDVVTRAAEAAVVRVMPRRAHFATAQARAPPALV